MKTRQIIIPAALAIALFSCNSGNEKEQQSLPEISKQELATALNERDQLLALVKEVSAEIGRASCRERVLLSGVAG